MIEIEDLKQYKHIHMIGIGGVSMSGIAEILHSCGFIVTGSDWAQSEITDKLVIQKLKINNIIILAYEILVFLIPYVMPTPKESILEERARSIVLINIISPLYIL